MDEHYLIKPQYSIGKGISALMLSRKFFDQHKNSFESKASLRALVDEKIVFPIVWLDQVHGAQVNRVCERKSVLIKNSDGLYTQCPNLVLAITTADCLPLILSNENGTEIAALHVGWRGLYQGIIERALSFFESDLKKVSAWLAPCISVGNYIVGEDVFYSFLNSDNESIVSFQESEREGKWFFNLKEESTRRLELSGIKTTSDHWCTYRDEESFYSHRKDGTSGRMVTLIWKNDEE